ncbi:MAG: endonuclease/exonuclease/phosphatase family protein [Gemmatimonadales bacterium]
MRDVIQPGDAPLHEWRANVGAPVALDLAPVETGARATSLVVLSWNVWVGRGRVTELVGRIREGAYQSLGAEPDAPLVVLLQEAIRADDSVPVASNGRTGRELLSPNRPREDVVGTARASGFSLRYSPSMRNRGDRSDRGNAILASLPLSDGVGVELPYVLQRRVAVCASVEWAGWRLRLVSAHLDPRGPAGYRWLGAAGRGAQAAHLVGALEEESVILGADLNLGRGRAERAWRLLGDAGFTFGVPPTLPSWRHTFHAVPRLVLDYLLVRDRNGTVAGLQVHRLDEEPRDGGVTVFGSDHHPLLGILRLQPSSPVS